MNTVKKPNVSNYVNQSLHFMQFFKYFIKEAIFEDLLPCIKSGQVRNMP